MKPGVEPSGESEPDTGTDENTGLNANGLVDMDIVSSTEIDEESVELNSNRGERVSSTKVDSSTGDDETAIVAETCSDKTEADSLTGSLVTGPASEGTSDIMTSVDLVGNICELLTDIPGTAVELAKGMVAMDNGVVTVGKGVVTTANGMVVTVKGVVATVNVVDTVADIDAYNVLDSGVDVNNDSVVETETDIGPGDVVGNTNEGVTAIAELEPAAEVDVCVILERSSVSGDSVDMCEGADCVVVELVTVVNGGSRVGSGVPILGVALGVPRICLLKRLATGRLSHTYQPITSRLILCVTFPL